MPTPANEYSTSPEQSRPRGPDPESMPLPGPAAVPPPQEYGTPSCESPRRITYSEACRPYTRGMRPLVKPVGVGASPICCRKLRPILEVTSDEVAEIPSTLLMIAMGSPGTLALGTCGSVVSQSPAHWPPLPWGRAGDPGAAGSHRSPGGPDVEAAWSLAPGPPAGADQLRAASSLAWAALRSSARRLASCCCSPNLRCTSISSATAAFWLDWASATALSAFCLAHRAADSLFTWSVRARCKLSITCRELAARVWPAAAVAIMSSGLAALR